MWLAQIEDFYDLGLVGITKYIESEYLLIA